MKPLMFLFLRILRWRRKVTYWSRRGVPGPTALPFFGTHLQQFITPMQKVEMERYRAYGRIYGVYDGTKPGLVVGDPTLAKVIMSGTLGLTTFRNRRPVKTSHNIMSNFLSSLEDKRWKEVRALVIKTFTPRRLRELLPVLHEASSRVQQHLAEVAQGPAEVNLKQLFGDYTMDVIARTAFGCVPDKEFTAQASRLFTFPFWRKFLDYTVPKWILDPLGFTVLPKVLCVNSTCPEPLR